MTAKKAAGGSGRRLTSTTKRPPSTASERDPSRVRKPAASSVALTDDQLEEIELGIKFDFLMDRLDKGIAKENAALDALLERLVKPVA